MSTSDLDVAVVHSEDGLRRAFRAWLGTTYRVSTYRVHEFLVRRPVEVDVLELEWAIGPLRRRAARSVAAAGAEAASVLALLDGVPAGDPIAEGADHDLCRPFDRDRVRLATDILALQRGYRTALEDYYRSSRDPPADPTADADLPAVKRRADGGLDALADHLTYSELFRRLFEN